MKVFAGNEGHDYFEHVLGEMIPGKRSHGEALRLSRKLRSGAFKQRESLFPSHHNSRKKRRYPKQGQSTYLWSGGYRAKNNLIWDQG